MGTYLLRGAMGASSSTGGHDCNETCGRHCYAKFDSRGTTPCYLCGLRVKNRDWENETHRRECKDRNNEELNSFPEPYAISCPHCRGQLKLWPAKGCPFLCDDWAPKKGKKCKSKGREIPSRGENRFNCFVCDYDLCEECVIARGAQKHSGLFKDDFSAPPSYF